jgi:aldehyde dehydrogenase (NAD+)
MSSQDTVSVIADAASELKVDRRLLIDGRLVTTRKTFPSINPATGAVQSGIGREMGVAGLEEFLERKTFAVPVLQAPAESVR